jgi:hypothetical protein
MMALDIGYVVTVSWWMEMEVVRWAEEKLPLR